MHGIEGAQGSWIEIGGTIKQSVIHSNEADCTEVATGWCDQPMQAGTPDRADEFDA